MSRANEHVDCLFNQRLLLIILAHTLAHLSTFAVICPWTLHVQIVWVILELAVMVAAAVPEQLYSKMLTIDPMLGRQACNRGQLNRNA